MTVPRPSDAIGADQATVTFSALVVQVNDRQLAGLLGEAPTSHTRLRVVRDIQQDDSGATVHFQDTSHGRLAAHDANYVAYLRLARRSQERQHPVGVTFAEGSTIAEVLRADNDVPLELSADAPGPIRVAFQGHDGVFRLKPDHPEAKRIRTTLDAAIREQARVWFVAAKSNLALVDVVPAGWAIAKFDISFVVAPDHLLKTADEILRSRLRCTKALRRDIQAVAKAYVDEADELNRAVHEIQTSATRIQLQSLSPCDMIERAKHLRTVQLTNKSLEGKVRLVADSYVLIAQENEKRFEEFKEKYRDKLPQTR